MNTKLLDNKFARIGARLKMADRSARRTRTSGVISLDVQADRKGEFYEITAGPGAAAEVTVLDVQPTDRHLLLLVREGKDKSKFLCGHDERHWFVAGIPESASVGTVRQAKEALKPAEVLNAQASNWFSVGSHCDEETAGSRTGRSFCTEPVARTFTFALGTPTVSPRRSTRAS